MISVWHSSDRVIRSSERVNLVILREPCVFDSQNGSVSRTASFCYWTAKFSCSGFLAFLAFIQEVEEPQLHCLAWSSFSLLHIKLACYIPSSQPTLQQTWNRYQNRRNVFFSPGSAPDEVAQGENAGGASSSKAGHSRKAAKMRSRPFLFLFGSFCFSFFHF